MARRIDSLVADIADDVSVDWRTVEGASQSGELVQQFRIIAAIGAGRDADPGPSRGFRIVHEVLVVAVAIAAAKMVVTTLAIATTVPFRLGPQGMLMFAFGLSGAALLVGGRRDVRAQVLGSLFLLIGSAFTYSYLLRALTSVAAVPAWWLLRAASESFLAVGLWAFTWVFPAPPRSSRVRTVGRWGLVVSTALGLTLAVANALTLAGPLDGYPAVQAVVHLLDRNAPMSIFWPSVLLVGGLGLPYLVWKSRAGTVDERARVSLLTLAMVAGLAPIILAVMAFPFVPQLARPEIRKAVGIWLYLAMAALVVAMAYSVLVHKALNLHLVIRQAVQHAFARQVVWMLTVGSVSYVVVSLYIGREQSLGELLSEQVGLVTLSAFGFGALTFRDQMLHGIDRWFQRSDADYSEVMARLANGMSGQRNLRELHATLTDELTRTLHATDVAIVVANDEQGAYVSLDGQAPSLPMSSAIADVFRSTRRALCLAGEDADPLARLLPLPDRQWLDTLRVEWVFPLFGSADSLLGLIGLGVGRGPTYSKRDRVLVSAMADQVALRMENLALHQWPGELRRGGHGRVAGHVDWVNEPAMQCPTCRTVSGAETTRCACGSALEPAAVPLVLNGKFIVQRILGAGGMGVVYLAVDDTLSRPVAIKSLPRVTPKHVARLQHEAKAMASVLHPNLALIYGAERWRDVPLLIVEYLDGGTMLEGLKAGPMAVDEVLDLGIFLADALDRMHAGGLLHRDIKPSNIGYTADGQPKLLDFGLAAMLHRVIDPTASSAATADLVSTTATPDPWPPGASRSLTQMVGTPLYVSPEALGGQEPEESFDLWSLCIVLYEAIAGRHPLAGYPAVEAMRRIRSVRLPDVRDFRADCPAGVAAFLNDALSLSPERRPATAAALRVQLQSLRHASVAASDRLAFHSLY